jgi:hypothetical protein
VWSPGKFVIESEAKNVDTVCKRKFCIREVYCWLGIILFLVEDNTLSFCGKEAEIGF